MSGSKAALLGTPPRLPLRLAAQVAWTSIRVRMSRSLVTVSSVVLAVAFLLVVVGENLANRAVWRDFTSDMRPVRDLRAIRSLVEKPRDDLDLLALLARADTPTREWARALTGEAAPPADPAQAKRAIALARWLDELKPADRGQILGTRTVKEWVLALDADLVARFTDVTKDLTGVTPPLTPQELTGLAAAMPQLRAALATLAKAEQRRMALIGDAGGGDALLDRALAGDGRGALESAGLPLAQALPDLDDVRWAAVRAQLRVDRARGRAVEALRRINDRDPSLPIVEDVLDWRAFLARLREQIAAPGDNPGKRLVASAREAGAALRGADPARADDAATRTAAVEAIDTALAEVGFYAPEAWQGIALPDIAADASRRDQFAERRLTQFNRALFDAAYAGLVRSAPRTAPPALDLAALAAGAGADHPFKPLIDAALKQALGDLKPDELWADQRARARLESLDATFTGIAFDPERSGARTFWLVALSLMVCIVGIVNTMMMAVTERFREIATMKCLGAMDSFILKSFLIESGATGSVGSLIGACIGLVLALAQASARFGGAFWSAFPAGAYALAAVEALGCGLVLAVLGALLPALKAARMHPIEAMRIDA